MLGASIVVGEPEVADLIGFAIGALASHGFVAPSLVVFLLISLLFFVWSTMLPPVRVVIWLSALAEQCAC